jgi:hypothetical protein
LLICAILRLSRKKTPTPSLEPPSFVFPSMGDQFAAYDFHDKTQVPVATAGIDDENMAGTHQVWILYRSGTGNPYSRWPAVAQWSSTPAVLTTALDRPTAFAA